MSIRSNRPCSAPVRGLRMMLAQRRGIASLEFVLVAPVLITLLLGGVDLGMAAQQRILIQAAVRAGGSYATSFPVTSTGSVNAAGIMTAVRSALPTSWTDLTVATPTTSCSCWTAGTTGPCAADPNPPCPGGMVERFITIQASRPYNGTGLLSSALGSNTATYVARYQ